MMTDVASNRVRIIFLCALDKNLMAEEVRIRTLGLMPMYTAVQQLESHMLKQRAIVSALVPFNPITMITLGVMTYTCEAYILPSAKPGQNQRQRWIEALITAIWPSLAISITVHWLLATAGIEGLLV
jgi:uncharacterized protein (DUF2062 family)